MEYGFAAYLFQAHNGFDSLAASYGWPSREQLMREICAMPENSSGVEVSNRLQQLLPLPENHRTFFEGLIPYAILPEGGGLVVHAHLSGKALRQRTLECAIEYQLGKAPWELVWDRDHISEPFEAAGRLIFGHTRYQIMSDFFWSGSHPWEHGPAEWNNKVAVDGGCGYRNGRLVAFNPYTKEFLTEPA
jgi:hypothetical protein